MIVGNGIFIDSAGFFDGAGLAAGINDVAAFGRRRREHEKEVSLSFVREDLETAPFFKFVERGFSDCGNAGTIFEESGLGREDFGRDFLRNRTRFRKRSVLVRYGRHGADQKKQGGGKVAHG